MRKEQIITTNNNLAVSSATARAALYARAQAGLRCLVQA